MKRTIKVYLGETPLLVGRLFYNVQGWRESAAFEYASQWLTYEDRFAIDATLPLISGPQYRAKNKNRSPFHGIIADSEPDGWGRRVILRDRAKQRQNKIAGAAVVRAELNALDFLLGVDDMSRIGALRYEDESGVFQRAQIVGKRTVPPMIELAQLLAATRAVESNTETAADLEFLRGRGTSLGGLRPKCTIVDEQGYLSIGKFPSIQDERAVTKGEVLALQLARKAGINAAEARLVYSDGTPIALIKRFDRQPGGWRVPYASAATMLSADDGDELVHTYTEIVDAIRIYGAAAQVDIEELWRRIAFSILITNVDDHLHNHAFLHVSSEKWRLSPAFDINPFPERHRELKTWISEDAGPEATIDALMSVKSYFLISDLLAKKILQEVEAAVATWRDEGQSIGMTGAELDQFADAFEHSQREIVKKFI